MPWFLENKETGKALCFLTAPGTFKIGRKDAEILIDEGSISRHHANLVVESLPKDQAAAVNSRASVFLTDLSKFGTTVNNTKLPTNSPHKLQEGDEIGVGTSKQAFVLRHLPLVFCFSTVDAAKQKKLKAQITGIGGHTTENAQEMTHLLMPKVTLSSKAFEAIQTGKPIVTADWIQAIVSRTKLTDPMPDASEFFPPTDIFTKEKLAPNPRRNTVFAGKKFGFFTSSDASRLSRIVTLSGGQCVGPVTHKTEGRNGKLAVRGSKSDYFTPENLKAYWVMAEGVSDLDLESKALLKELGLEVKKTATMVTAENIGNAVILPEQADFYLNKDAPKPNPPPSPAPTNGSAASSTGERAIGPSQAKPRPQASPPKPSGLISTDQPTIKHPSPTASTTTTADSSNLRKRKRSPSPEPQPADFEEDDDFPQIGDANNQHHPQEQSGSQQKSGKTFRKTAPLFRPPKLVKLG